MNNSLTLIGHVGQAPRSVSFANTGNSVVKFSLGVKEFSNNEESTLWIDVDCWNGLGENVMKTITKGREVVLQGRLAINSYTKVIDGVKHEIHKPVLKLTTFHLCGPKPSTASQADPTSSYAGETENAETSNAAEPTAGFDKESVAPAANVKETARSTRRRSR